jgi:hypothetical protein
MGSPAAVASQAASTNGADPGKQTLQTFSLDDLAQYTIGSSPSHQISHTKGGVLDGIVGFEGSNFPKVIKGPVRGTPSNHIADGGT